MKGVQATDVEIDEDAFEEVVDKVRGDHEKKRAEKQEDKQSKNKVSDCDFATSYLVHSKRDHRARAKRPTTTPMLP